MMILICIVFYGITSSADSYVINSTSIGFDNQGTGIQSTSAQGAINELNSKIATKVNIFKKNSASIVLHTNGLCNILVTNMNWFDRQSSLTYIRITTQPSYYKTVLSGNDIFSYSKNGNDITITNTNSYEEIQEYMLLI